MKKLLTLVILITTALGMMAQNYNRSGVFVSAGLTYRLENTPILGAKVDGTKVVFENANKHGFSIGAGYRYTRWRNKAVEMLLKWDSNFSHPDATAMLKIMPGVKYFSDRRAGAGFAGINAGLVLSSPGSELQDGLLVPCKALSPTQVGYGYMAELGYMFKRHISVVLSLGTSCFKAMRMGAIDTIDPMKVCVKMEYKF